MAKGPTRLAAPRSTISADVVTALAEIAKSVRKGGHKASSNPSKVPVNRALRVTSTQRPGKRYLDELIRPPASPPLGTGRRAPGLAPPQDSGQSLLDELGAPGLADEQPRVDRTETISPPPSIEPGRPRATEASYDPDSRTMRVVFRNGGTYAYYGVPWQTWRALKTNKSFGQTLDRLVINVYKYEKVAF